MSNSEDNHHHHHQHHPQASWYPPDAPSHTTHAKQQQYYRPPTHHYPHPGQMHPHHAVPYGHHQYPYHYTHGHEENTDDSNTPSATMNSNQRDSFPHYHPYHPQQATPIQPPPNAYNGPPVSALVPRFPRGPTTMYSHGGYTPHAVYYDSHNSNSCPPSTEEQKDSTSHVRGDLSSKDRRTSFGIPTISSYPNFLIPTPQHVSSCDVNDASSEDSSKVIPAPPTNEKDSDSKLEAVEADYSKQESRCVNLLSKKFEPSACELWSSSLPQNEVALDGMKKAPTVQDASLLLGLTVSYDTSNNSSPATVPTLRDEPDTTEIMPNAKDSSENEVPKTWSPVPIPSDYPKRLALPNDTVKLNALHCFIRAELLEIFVVEPSPEALKFRHAPSSAVGRVGLRCVHCANSRNTAIHSIRDDDAPMSVFYPKTVSEIYRLVTSWQRCHVRKCKNLPKDVREKWFSLRVTEKCRGKTAYWVDSAKKIGLVDCTSRMGGIRFDVNNDGESVIDSKVKKEDAVITPTSSDENSAPLVTSNTTASTTTNAPIVVNAGSPNKRKIMAVTTSPSKNRDAMNNTLSPLGSKQNTSNLLNEL